MTSFEWIGLGIAAIAGAFTALARIYKWGPFLETEAMPSTDNITEIELKTPDLSTDGGEVVPTTPTEVNEGQKEVLLWDTQKQAWHSVRVMCDKMGLTYDQKNEICYTIWGESEFKIKVVGKPNKNGTRDYGICQFNDGKNAKGIPFWIGKGAAFKDVDEVLNNPEKCVRIMIQEYKNGHIGWWYGHKGYSPEAVKASPMWKLAV